MQDDALALSSGKTKLSVIRLPFEQYKSYMETHQDDEPLYLFQELDTDIGEAKAFSIEDIYTDFILCT